MLIIFILSEFNCFLNTLKHGTDPIIIIFEEYISFLVDYIEQKNLHT